MVRIPSLRRIAPELTSFGMRIAFTGLAFLVTVLLARLLAPDVLGQYYEAAAWALLLGAMVQSGWAPFLVREVAALREQGREREVAGITRLATGIVAAIAAGLCTLFLAGAYLTGTDAETMQRLLIGAPIVLFLSTSTMREAVTRGMGRPLLGQICETLSRPGIQLLGLACFWLGIIRAELTASGAIAILTIAVALSAVLAFLVERRTTAEARRGEKKKHPLPDGWLGSFLRNAIIGWSTAANLQVGTLVLASAASDPEVAQFRIAQQLALLMPIGLTAVGMLYAPHFSQSFARQDFAGLQAYATRASVFSLLAALPLALLYFLLGPAMIDILFGSQFAAVYVPLIILTAGQLANTFFGANTAICVATRSESAAVKAHVTSAICNVVACLLLVPWLGTIGAALGASVSLIAWNVVLFIYLQREFGISSCVGFRGLAAQKS